MTNRQVLLIDRVNRNDICTKNELDFDYVLTRGGSIDIDGQDYRIIEVYDTGEGRLDVEVTRIIDYDYPDKIFLTYDPEEMDGPQWCEDRVDDDDVVYYRQRPDETMITKLRQAEAVLLALAEKLDVPIDRFRYGLDLSISNGKFWVTTYAPDPDSEIVTSGKTLEEAYLKALNEEIPF